jgi:hypothetical protein
MEADHKHEIARHAIDADIRGCTYIGVEIEVKFRNDFIFEK